MVLSPEAPGRVLVRLVDISQELTVGVGAAIASVRTLTDVSLVVRSRELVVVAGDRGAGERAMLAVIGGDRRGVSGTREIHSSARMRALRISASAARALAHEWQRANTESRHHAHYSAMRETACDVFLLDVVAEADAPGQPDESSRLHQRRWLRTRLATSSQSQPRAWDERNRAQLANWTKVCHRRGGAIVMAADEAFGMELIRQPHAAREPGGPAREAAPGGVHTPWTRAAYATVRPASVREASTHELTASATPPRDLAPFTVGVRLIAMHCGRVAASVTVPGYSHTAPS